MDLELSETENNHIYHNYPQIFTLKKCINPYIIHVGTFLHFHIIIYTSNNKYN